MSGIYHIPLDVISAPTISSKNLVTGGAYGYEERPRA